MSPQNMSFNMELANLNAKINMKKIKMSKIGYESTVSFRLQQHFQKLMENLPSLPNGVSWLLPLRHDPATVKVTKLFLDKYYNDNEPRSLILGINPGRFGAGITNVAFTGPVMLEQECGIDNPFHKRAELSAVFIYKIINAWGGVAPFYKKYFINSIVPFGFVKNGVNYNYYDDKNLQMAMVSFIKFHLEKLLEMGMNNEVCFCLGEGKNFKFLNKLNDKEKYFGKIIPLSHPRYIMQYKRKKLEEYIGRYVDALRGGNLELNNK